MTDALQKLLGNQDNSTEVPEHLQRLASDDHKTELGADDVAFPRFSLLQPTSQEVAQRREAQAGMFHISTTGELIEGDLSVDENAGVYIVQLAFHGSHYPIFRDSKKGGGFFGRWDTEAEALAAIEELDGEPKDYTARQTHSRVIGIVKATDKELSLDCVAFWDLHGSAMTQSRDWNSMLENSNALEKDGKKVALPCYSTIYRVTSVAKSRNGNHWNVPVIEQLGFTPASLTEDLEVNYRLANQKRQRIGAPQKTNENAEEVMSKGDNRGKAAKALN